MNLELSRRAEQDLDEIEYYTVQQFGVGQWQNYAGRLQQGFESLLSFPFLGISDRRLPRGHQALRVGQHWICYEVVEDVVQIKAVIRGLDMFDVS